MIGTACVSLSRDREWTVDDYRFDPKTFLSGDSGSLWMLKRIKIE